VRVIPNDRSVSSKSCWSSKGSVSDGRIIALNREAGYQAELLRGGCTSVLALAVPRHVVPLVTVPQGQIGTFTRATATRCRPARRWAAWSNAALPGTPVHF